MRHETKESHQALIARLAEEAFAKHELIEEAPGRWRCGKPRSSAHSFRVICAPGVVIVYGDIADMILHHSDGGASIGWLRGAARSPSYLLGKNWHRQKRRQFFPGEARSLLARYIREADDQASRRKRLGVTHGIRDAWLNYDEGGNDGDAFCRAWCEAGLEAEDLGACFGPDSESLWCVLGLQWFVTALERREAAAQREEDSCTTRP